MNKVEITFGHEGMVDALELVSELDGEVTFRWHHTYGPYDGRRTIEQILTIAEIVYAANRDEPNDLMAWMMAELDELGIAYETPNNTHDFIYISGQDAKNRLACHLNHAHLLSTDS